MTAVSAAYCGTSLPTLLDDVLGRHSWDIPVSVITPPFFKYALASTVLYTIGAVLIKVSVLALCLRIFSPSRRAGYAIWLGIVFITSFYVALLVAQVYFFAPHTGDGGWGSPKNNKRSGYPARVINFAQGIVGVVSDFYVLGIPIVLVLKLYLPLRKRIGVSCIFITGLLFAELNIGILCACMPVGFVVFRGLVLKVETSMWSLLKYFRSRSRIPDASPDTNAETGITEPATSPLPKIPRWNLTGLTSLFRNSQPEQPKTESTSSLNATKPTYIELTSVDYDYHSQMKQQASGGSQ
ncbi:hypothetical protein GGR57DRAFT_506356 [Xylariaceae sp. FL1272]|nr:hypothetical protein GGR57DRAFT_506356 [Xylariaceae sp. FL1272]